MINKREQDALTAYFRFLQNKGVNSASLEQREKILTQLDIYVASIPNDGNSYREAVDNCLTHVDKSEWPSALHIMREYFLFWTGNTRLIASIDSNKAFDLDPKHWKTLDGNLKDIWATLDKEKFSETDTLALEAYAHALRQQGVKETALETRIKLAKLLLLRLKDISAKGAKLYRKAGDATAPVFEMKQTRTLFFLVVREFYYFWMGDENAADYIFKESTKQKYK